MTQPGTREAHTQFDSMGTCRTAHCHRCGAALGRVCTDGSHPNARMRHTLDRWVGELSQSIVSCGRCCALPPRPR
jgi:peptide methionine sulfoxide reductase MsrB